MSDTMRYRVKKGDVDAKRLQVEWLEKAVMKTTDANEFDLDDRIKELKNPVK